MNDFMLYLAIDNFNMIYLNNHDIPYRLSKKHNKLDEVYLKQLKETNLNLIDVFDCCLSYHAYQERKRVNKRPMTLSFIKDNYVKAMQIRKHYNKYRGLDTLANYYPSSTYLKAIYTLYNQNITKDDLLAIKQSYLDDFHHEPYNEPYLEKLRLKLQSTNNFILLKGLKHVSPSLVIFTNLVETIPNNLQSQITYYLGVEKLANLEYDKVDLEFIFKEHNLIKENMTTYDFF